MLEICRQLPNKKKLLNTFRTNEKILLMTTLSLHQIPNDFQT